MIFLFVFWELLRFSDKARKGRGSQKNGIRQDIYYGCSLKLSAITKFILDKFFYCLLFSITYAWKGYGDMVCRTPAGRIFSIFFIVSSVPMWFNILAQLGYFLHLLLFKLWTALRCFLCGTRYHFKGSVYVYILRTLKPRISYLQCSIVIGLKFLKYYRVKHKFSAQILQQMAG